MIKQQQQIQKTKTKTNKKQTKGKTDYHCKIKETLFIQELEPAFNVNVGSDTLIRLSFIYNSNIVRKSNYVICNIVNRGGGFEAWQTSKEQTKMPRALCCKIHDPAQSFVLRSYTMYELRNQHVSIGWFLSME